MQATSRTETVTEIIMGQEPQILSNGDRVFTSEGNSHPKLVIAEAALPSADKLSQLADLGDDPRKNQQNFSQTYRKTVTREKLDGFIRRHFVAVKRISPDSPLDGVDLFEAMRTLQNEGVVCASPLLATKTRFIARWIDGMHPQTNEEDQAFYGPYRGRLGEVVGRLIDEGKLNQRWQLSIRRENYVVANMGKINALERFTALSPLSVSTSRLL